MSDTDRVPKHCSCGAELPPDALFCHKCGRPQVELPEVEPLPPPPSPEPATPPPPPAINFRNRMAVRVGLLAAVLSSLLSSLPLPAGLNFLTMLVGPVAAGFFAVYLYHRRIGGELSARMGARMGWITGVFCFTITAIMFTITMIMISMQGGLTAFYREQLGQQRPPGVNLEEFFTLIENPAALAVILLVSLALMFVFLTLLAMLGGAMGAKVLEQD